MKEVRVRFAPSPTGALHIGGVRTALYNYLFAKKHQGKFILRIEDTDQTRFVEGAEEYISNTLNWLGLTPDESVHAPGDFGPYKQSERKEFYKKHAQQLLDEGKAYYAFDSSEELDEMRQRLKDVGAAATTYNAISRTTMKNSLTLSEEEVKQRLASGDPYVIRLKVPSKEEIRLNDAVRGWVVVHSSAIDDKILLKSDGMPTYHLANVVDDYHMKITHVIRGEEWLPSAPLHVLLYRSLGWEDDMPQFAHLPLLLKPDGNGKLSKRAADQLGFPIFPLDWKDPQSGELSKGFKEQGYRKEALVNFLALLGWNSGTEQELFSLEELVNTFSLDRIVKSGAKFDIEKAKWFNEQYLRKEDLNSLAKELQPILKENEVDASLEETQQYIQLMIERITFLPEVYSKAQFLFTAPTEYDEKVARKRWSEETAHTFAGFTELIPTILPYTSESIHDTLVAYLEEKQIKMGKVMQALRLSVTGQASGPDLMKIMELLGPTETVHRINSAITILEPYTQNT